MMKKIIFFLFPLYGHVMPNIKVIEALKNASFDVTCVCGPKFDSLLKPLGVNLLYYDKTMLSSYEHTSSKEVNETEYSYYLSYFHIENVEWNFVQLMHQYIHIMESIEALISFQPDIVLYDSVADWGLIYGRKHGIPCFCMEAATEIKYNNHLFHNFYQEIVLPEINADTKLGLCKPEDLENILSFEQYIKVVTRMNQKLEKRKSLLAQEDSQIPLSPDKTLVHLTKQFYQQFANDLEKKEFCGFSIERKDQVMKENSIFITRGTSLNSFEAHVLGYLIDAVKDRNMNILVTTGGYQIDSLKAKETSQVMIKKFIDQNDALNRCKLMICHGGITGIREAIINETPMIVYPSNFHDYQVAYAIERLGIGIFLKDRMLSKGDMRELKNAVDEMLLDNPTKYTNRIQQLKKELMDTANDFDIIKSLLQ